MRKVEHLGAVRGNRAQRLAGGVGKLGANTESRRRLTLGKEAKRCETAASGAPPAVRKSKNAGTLHAHDARARPTANVM
jgi:hypothetical protein